ncbi:MAG: hypothetical protein ABIH83_01920 [Candidatus Micrarchaeota archaeon]
MMDKYDKILAKRKIKTIKFEISPHRDFRKQMIRDIEAGKAQKEDLIVYFADTETFAKFFTKERLRLLRTIKNEKPKSLYALAKMLKRDFKNVQTDAKFLETTKLITLEKYKVGKKKKLRPRTSIKKIELEMEI